MTDGSPPASASGAVCVGAPLGRRGEQPRKPQRGPPRAPRSLSPPEPGPEPKAGVLEDRRSLASVDSGIPTLEVGDPEPVPCSAVPVRQCAAEAVAGRACRSACPPPCCPAPAAPGAERGPGVRKSSTFPRTGFDAARLDGPTCRALPRGDQASVGSVSSLGTELSASLSVSDEDLVGLVVPSSSSAIVTLESDDDPRLSDVALGCPPQARAAAAEAGSQPRPPGPLSRLLSR
ncbi:TBC1 domain family member 14 [Galemys pyrenaicus]|uniref:TBC1 domain family member 14 n=1 Tax=Galemys pyrenaicus TaxID=202257 RepID=A0A8J5ZR40_GALPY|nr:TBC1 domain family member 14 [Galemys pyrenaicus]